MIETSISPVSRQKVLRLKTYALLGMMIACASTGDVLLSVGMKAVGKVKGWSLGAILPVLGRAMTSGLVWLGILLLIIFFLCYMFVLSWADLSFVSPASAMGYAIVALLGYFFLGEHVPSVRWLGIGLICIGVGLVGRTHPSTTQD